jgi:hypothetical protein
MNFGKNNPTLLNKGCLVSILLICIFIIITTQHVQAAIMYLVTQSATAGTYTQSPTATSSTPSLTFTPSSTPTETPTTTLVPLPAITLIFPAPTNTSRSTITPVIASNINTAKPTEMVKVTNLTPRIKLLEIMVIGLWIFLVSFVIILIRQFR